MDDLKFAPERPTTDLSAGLQQFTRLFVGDEQMLARWAALSGEFGQSMTAQLVRNLDTIRALAQCREPAEFIELQLRWARDTWDDYMAETHRLMTGGLVAGQSGTVVAKPVAPKREPDRGPDRAERSGTMPDTSSGQEAHQWGVGTPSRIFAEKSGAASARIALS